MSKKNFLILVLFITLFIGLFLTLETFRNNPDGINITLEDKTRSTILLDINPSLKIELNRDDLIIKILTISGEDYTEKDYKDKTFDSFIKDYINILIDKNIVSENQSILLNVDGLVDKNKIEDSIREVFNNKNIALNIEYVEIEKDGNNVQGINKTKLAYIQSIIKELDFYKVEDLEDKTINELSNIKNSELYCDKEYILEGSSCLKQIGEEEVEIGKVCPPGYESKNKKCYKAESPYEELGCTGGQTLEEGTCVGTKKIKASIQCEDGEYDSSSKKCVKYVYIGEAIEYCRKTPSTDLYYNGRCLGRKKTVNGQCLNNDKKIDDYCYDVSEKAGYEAELKCPNGELKKITESKQCYEKKYFKYTYVCEDGYTLEKDKCVTNEKTEPEMIKKCKSGFTLEDNNICYNYKQTTNFISGNVCKKENSKMIGNKCIIYEIIPASKKEKNK